MPDTDDGHAVQCGSFQNRRHFVGILIIKTGVHLVGKQYFGVGQQRTRKTHAGRLTS